VTRESGFRFLCAVLGAIFVLLGGVLFSAFFRFHMPGSDLSIPTGPTGFYFVGFAGCALVGWGGCLLGAARRPGAGRSVGTATAVALVLAALMRIAAWTVGDYYAWLGELPRTESVLMLLAALAFVWLRPPGVAAERA
jgi:hypothetical protein